MIYVIIACLILLVAVIFSILYCKKTNKVGKSLAEIKKEYEKITEEMEEKEANRQEISEEIYQLGSDLSRNKAILNELKNQITSEREHLEVDISSLKESRQKELENEFAAKYAEKDKQFNADMNEMQNTLNKYKVGLETSVQKIKEALEAAQEQRDSALSIYRDQIQSMNEKLNSLLEPLKLYEKDKQEKLYYTVQVPLEYRDDIDFLLNEVSKKVEHPDIISKLVWNEYIKPNLDETFKRIGIGEESGIYKLTSLVTGKCYIGKSTNLKTRISNHYKSVIGIKSIADQAVHHAIAEEGVWNWTIEKLCDCSKEDLNENEKYYIQFFHAQEFGYNKTAGG